jgi:ribose 5-phosphate isomerase
MKEKLQKEHEHFTTSGNLIADMNTSLEGRRKYRKELNGFVGKMFHGSNQVQGKYQGVE